MCGNPRGLAAHPLCGANRLRFCPAIWGGEQSLPQGAALKPGAAAAFDEFLPAAGQPPLVCDLISGLLK